MLVKLGTRVRVSHNSFQEVRSRQEGRARPIQGQQHIACQDGTRVHKFTTQVEQLHKAVSTLVSRQRKEQMEAHNARTHLVEPNFHPGDYVLREVPKLRQHKLSLTWKGPHVVDNAYSNNTLRLRSLIKDVTLVTHVTRTRMFRDSDHAQRQDMSAVQLTAEFNHYVP
jgi:hypothetical protein